MFHASLVNAINNIIEVFLSRVPLEYIRDILEQENEDTSSNKQIASTGGALLNLNKTIEFKNFTFGYKNANRNLFDNFNYTINNNQSLCIVGKSGTGKSTLLSILSGLIEVDKNHIFINNIDITNIPLKIIREKIAFMPSGEYFFEGNIFDNIALFESIPNEKRILSILEGLDLLELVGDRLYDNLIDIQSSFSTGQKQRILLARTLYKNSDLILLDEPTSALDIATEERVMQYIMSLDTRMIIITHRESVSKYFKNILSF